MLNINNTLRYYLIGHSRYKFDGSEGLRLNCIDEYENGNDDAGGAFSSIIAAPYDQSSKLDSVEMGLFNPAIVEFTGKTVKRGNNSVLIATDILSVTPYEEWNKDVKPSSPNKSGTK